MSNPEAAFAAEMEQTYREAAKRKYRATYFLQMLSDHGSIGAARRLLADEHLPEGLMRLYELDLLNLSVEAVVLKPDYAALFSPAERQRARERLATLKYQASWDQRDA